MEPSHSLKLRVQLPQNAGLTDPSLERVNTSPVRSPALNLMQFWLRQRKQLQNSPQHRLTGKPPRSPPADSAQPQFWKTSSPATTVFDATDLDDYILGDILGQGAYSLVREALHTVTNRKVALKTYQKANLSTAQRKKLVFQEIQALERLRHRNIIKLYEKVETGQDFHLILEFIGGMSLHGFIRRKVSRRLSEVEAKVIFAQVVEAVAYCHDCHVTHRDVKLENVIVDEELNVKLIDFGFATCTATSQKAKVFCGTPSYMAPEIVMKRECYGPPLDVWALGVLLYVLVAGHFPFQASTEVELYRQIMRCQYTVPEYISLAVRQLISKILRIDPRHRPTAREILEDPWLEAGQSHSEFLSECGMMNLEGCSVGGEPIDMNIVSSIVSPKQKNLGYTDSQIIQELHNHNSQVFKMYSRMKSRTGLYVSFS